MPRHSKREAEYILSLKDHFSKEIDRAIRKVDRLDDRFEKTQKGANRLGATFTKLGGVIGGAFVASRLGDFVGEITRTSAKFQGLSNAITFASGSSEEGAKSIAFLRKESNRLGTSIEGNMEGFKTFQGAMIGTKFGAKEVRNMFRQINTASSAMNLTSEDSKGIFLALGQVMSKGKVQAEELRGQIGERIPGAFQIAARAMGMTTMELDKTMQNGKLYADDFLPNFAAELEKTFQGALPKSTKSLQANLNRMGNAWAEFKIGLGENFSPLISGVLKRGTQLLRHFTNNTEQFSLNTQQSMNVDFGMLMRGNLSLDNRKNLIEKINSKYKAYLPHLLSEKTTEEDLVSIRNQSNKALEKEILLKTEGKKILELRKRVASGRIGAAKLELEAAKIQETAYFRSLSTTGKDPEKVANDYARQLNKTLTEKDTKALEKAEKDFKALGGKLGVDLEEMFGLKKDVNGDLNTAVKGKGSKMSGDIVGRKSQNTYITIEKLIENIDFKGMGGESDIRALMPNFRDEVTKALITSINDINIVTK